MTDTPDDTNFDPAVGDKVSLVVDHERVTGRVVEDFADDVVSASELGRSWGIARRWAVALDSGRLVFVDHIDPIGSA